MTTPAPATFVLFGMALDTQDFAIEQAAIGTMATMMELEVVRFTTDLATILAANERFITNCGIELTPARHGIQYG